MFFTETIPPSGKLAEVIKSNQRTLKDNYCILYADDVVKKKISYSWAFVKPTSSKSYKSYGG